MLDLYSYLEQFFPSRRCRHTSYFIALSYFLLNVLLWWLVSPYPSLSSAQELSQEIKSFINGIDIAQGRKLSVREHARCAVRLLRSVPACRGAVLEHLRGVYDEHVSTFLHNLETEGDAGSGVSSNLEDIIQVCWHMDTHSTSKKTILKYKKGAQHDKSCLTWQKSILGKFYSTCTLSF